MSVGFVSFFLLLILLLLRFHAAIPCCSKQQQKKNVSESEKPLTLGGPLAHCCASTAEGKKITFQLKSARSTQLHTNTYTHTNSTRACCEQMLPTWCFSPTRTDLVGVINVKRHLPVEVLQDSVKGCRK